MEKQWGDIWVELADAAKLLALAPDDELLAEILALQSELLQQMAVNQERSAAILEAALQDVPNQLEAASQRQLGVQVAKAWIAVCSDMTRNFLFICPASK